MLWEKCASISLMVQAGFVYVSSDESAGDTHLFGFLLGDRRVPRFIVLDAAGLILVNLRRVLQPSIPEAKTRTAL